MNITHEGNLSKRNKEGKSIATEILDYLDSSGLKERWELAELDVPELAKLPYEDFKSMFKNKINEILNRNL